MFAHKRRERERKRVRGFDRFFRSTDLTSLGGGNKFEKVNYMPS